MKYNTSKYKLSDLAIIGTGKSNSQDANENGKYLLFDRSSVIKRSDHFLFECEAVIVPGEGKKFIPRYFSGKFDLHQRAYRITSKDESKCLTHFLYYFILQNDGYLEQIAVGSTVKSLRLNSFTEYPVVLPSIDVQKEIVKTLSNLDEKLRLNIGINISLEEMTQAIFKDWFVDFSPVKAQIRGEQPEGMDAATASLFPRKLVESELGLIPEGWEVKPLDTIADFQNGLALQKFRPESNEDEFLPVLKIAQLRKGYCDGKEKARTNIKESCRVYDGDVIFSWSGSLMVDLWTGGNAALNQHLFKVTSKEYSLPMYLYWTKHHLTNFQQIAKDKAVTMGHIKRGHLSESMCLIPSKALQRKLDEILLPLIDQCINLRLQSNKLSELRDTLLPKLLSGEVTLAEPEVQGE